jgi:acetyl esterase/lipase
MDALTEVEIAELLDPETAIGISDTLTAHLHDGDLTVEYIRELDRSLAVIPAATGTSEWIRRPDDSQLELRLYFPGSPDNAISRSVVLWIHGGGMFLGSARQDDALCQELSEALGVRIASVDYRLAPEHPYPEPLDDCYRALMWLAERNDHIVVAGASAGGGLAAALALLTRDRSGPCASGVQLWYPMLDDRPTPSARRLARTSVWNERLNRLGWSAYLASRPADAYAAPARATDLSDLPPMYIDAGELDMFVDEDIDFAERLRAAGGSVELTLVQGAVHGWDLIAPDAEISRRAFDRRVTWLRDVLRTDYLQSLPSSSGGRS